MLMGKLTHKLIRGAQRFSGVAFLVLLPTAICLAQSASLRGVVVDQNGAVVSGAAVYNQNQFIRRLELQTRLTF
jgi:hypothetical protein